MGWDMSGIVRVCMILINGIVAPYSWYMVRVYLSKVFVICASLVDWILCAERRCSRGNGAYVWENIWLCKLAPIRRRRMPQWHDNLMNYKLWRLWGVIESLKRTRFLKISFDLCERWNNHDALAAWNVIRRNHIKSKCCVETETWQFDAKLNSSKMKKRNLKMVNFEFHCVLRTSMTDTVFIECNEFEFDDDSTMFTCVQCVPFSVIHQIH